MNILEATLALQDTLRSAPLAPVMVPMLTDTAGGPISKMQAPGGGLPSLAELFAGDPSFVSSMAGYAAVLGDSLWLVTYILVLVVGFRQKTYGIPLLAVALNFSWEFYFAVLAPPAAIAERVIHTIWFAVDVVIVWQLFRYGRAAQSIELVKRHFPAVVITTIGLTLVGEVSYHSLTVGNSVFADTKGAGMAYLINLVMSVLFVFMYFGRPYGRGLSYGVAWTKLLGTAFISISNTLVFLHHSGLKQFEVAFKQRHLMYWLKSPDPLGTQSMNLGFYYFLFVTVFLFDVLYVVLLHRRRREALPAP